MSGGESLPFLKKFTVIPAIDLKGGEVVRLMRGEMAQATVYSRDPATAAREFDSSGAALIHVVDLDGAIAGEPRNLEAIRAIRSAVRCGIDVSGGLRDIQAVRSAFAAGAACVSIGSAAILNPQLLADACREFPGRVIGSVDARDGRLAIKGWVEKSELTVAAAIERFKTAGVVAATVTDISRDGAETGVDAAQMAELARAGGVPIIASGGVAKLEDISALARRFHDGIVGVVVGRALYKRRFTLAEAIAAAA
jgi:phosphoribosylformimino-5-aminoimidazole carboxamide ribotide isomerase